jgi:hypothetical protein
MTNCDRESIKTLVVLHGQRKAARIAGLSENTVKSWALRYHWNKLPKPSPHPAHPIRTQSPAAIVADELSQNKGRSTLALSRYTAQASEQAAEHPDKLGIAGKVKDVAGVHTTLWPPEQNPNPILNLAILTGARVPRRINDQNATDEKQTRVKVLEAESHHEPVTAKNEGQREVTWQSRDRTPALDSVPQPTRVEIAAQVKRQKEAEYRERCRDWRRHT